MRLPLSPGQRPGRVIWMVRLTMPTKPWPWPNRQPRRLSRRAAHFTIGLVRAVTGLAHESHLSLQKAIRLSETAGDSVHRSLSLHSCSKN